MGTRSLTRVFNNDTEICCIYRQFDGYKSGHGKQLAEFLNSRKFVNGISGNRSEVFNGMGCFAAALVCHLKPQGEAGHIYLYEPGTSDVGEEFVYEVRGGIASGFEPSPVTVSCVGYENFPAGSPEEFLAWCNTPAPEDD